MENTNPYAPPAGGAYPPLGMGGPNAGHAGPESYEFDEVENVLIAKTAKRVKIWGIISYVIGILSTVGVLVMLFVPMQTQIKVAIVVFATPLLITHLAIAHFYVSSGNALQAVVDTQGDDVAHLLAGIKRLGLAFKIEALVMLIAMVAGFIAGIAIAATGTDMSGMGL